MGVYLGFKLSQDYLSNRVHVAVLVIDRGY